MTESDAMWKSALALSTSTSIVLPWDGYPADEHSVSNSEIHLVTHGRQMGDIGAHLNAVEVVYGNGTEPGWIETFMSSL